MLLSMKVSNLKAKKFLEYFKSLKEEKVVCLIAASYVCGDLSQTVVFDISAASQATGKKNLSGVEGMERDSRLPSMLCKLSWSVKMMDFPCSWPGKG